MTDTERNRAFVTEAFAAWTAGDNQRLFAKIVDDVRWTLAGTCPGGGTHTSKEEFLAKSARPLHGRLSRSPIPNVRAIWADGDTVIVHWWGEGRTKEDRPYQNEYCWILRFRGDSIVEITSFLDTLAVANVFRAAEQR